MNNNASNKIIYNESKSYVHLKEEEIMSFTKNSSRSNSKIKKYKEFKMIFSDLKEFETILKKEELREDFIKLYNWHITILAYYNRINIPDNIIFMMKFYLYELKNIDNELDYIKSKFRDVMVNKYSYGMSYVRQVMHEVIRLKLFYQKSVKSCFKHIDQYLELAKEYEKKYIIISMIEFLKKIDYIDDEEKIFIREESIDLNSKNTSIEFNEITRGYLKEIKTQKAIKTFRATKSHLKNFFDFMENEFQDVNKFEKLSNNHIREYINYLNKTKTCRKKSISPSTINARIEECAKLFNYIEQNISDVKSIKIITKYDKVKEYKMLPKYVSKKDVERLLKAINKIDEEKYPQEKLIIILMVDTGRRVHEICSLSYNCLRDNNYIFFHKTKKGVSINQKVGDLSVKAVLNAQKICSTVDNEMYSKIDNLKIRRLFASKKNKFRSIVSNTLITRIFKEIQIENGIVDCKNEPLFSLHDNKRNFISNMESAGITAVGIAELLDQKINTIVQYEVRNDKAINTLKDLERKGILIGKREENIDKIEKENVYDLLNDKDIIKRNNINLIEKMQNPKQVIPLPLGQCTQIENAWICGQLYCMACENYTLLSDKDKEGFGKFCEEFYIHMYLYRKDERIKEIRRKFEEISKNVLINNNIVDASSLKKHINSIKKKSRMKVEMIRNGEV
ncbi:tyrosine-type recombinase/integrase [Clostridium cibarium]|uniref:Tyrosine-type recombinase/integrase n=1 Tax=Clostridium cibarium TaxID=2762247 RepID=A0ABR8PPE9_9CLOT|nr:tyrosine-type recombinase/integrase [Clostridium cibarium]MBD7910043.1 tyrosine-type recombinase/integrase [Clostridium cibarium]